MKDKLKQYPEYAIELLTTPPTDIVELVVPPSTLVENFTAAMDQYSDISLGVKDGFGESKSMKLHKVVICQASPYFKALIRFKNSSNIDHETPIPLEAFCALAKSWYTGIVKATPSQCFYLVVSSDFYTISGSIIKQCLEEVLLLNKSQIKDIVNSSNLELLHWIKSSKHLETIWDEETKRRINKIVCTQYNLMHLIEQSPLVVQLKQQFQSLQKILNSLQEQFETQQKSIEGLYQLLKSSQENNSHSESK